MKRRIIKILACSLAVCMSLPLCGCAGSDNKGSSTQNSGISSAETSENSSGKEADNDSEYSHGMIINNGECGNDAKWELDKDGLLVISGSGEITFAPWRSAKTVIIKNGITGIGEGAFSDCSYLTDITIPDSVKSIGESAFDNCTGLTSITIPESVTSMEIIVFNEWTPSQTIYIKGKGSEPEKWNIDWDSGCYAKIVWNA